ncbi:hypothetical protein [Streptomyces avicenniae]|uniref:hypothetical protein n=1 Tax=Streptomyces avicenniae TaxID=500153 RepID=UPI00069AB199|nr:hypothetical protein [Streptomyces avicenniae]
MRRALLATAAVTAMAAALYACRRQARTRRPAYAGDPPPTPGPATFPPPAVINIPTEEALFRRMFPDG